MRTRERDPESMRRAGGPDDDPASRLWVWLAALPVGAAVIVLAVVYLDVVLAVAVVAFVVALGAIALFGDELLGGDWF
jgi:hypothetical protein